MTRRDLMIDEGFDVSEWDQEEVTSVEDIPPMIELVRIPLRRSDDS